MKKRKVSYIVLIILAITTVVFTATCLWLFYLYQSVPDTLVQYFYTTIVGELLCSMLIKVFKVRKENSNDNGTDNDIG